MPNIKSIFRSTPLILAAVVTPNAFAADLELLCTVSADRFPGFEDGTLQSKTVVLTGMQGEVGGEVTIYENSSFRFRVITGRSQIQDRAVTLRDYYVEAQDLESQHSIRAASSSYAGGPHHARLEMVAYTPETDWYEGIVIFQCIGSS